LADCLWPPREYSVDVLTAFDFVDLVQPGDYLVPALPT
jgi:hypothetical protein